MDVYQNLIAEKDIACEATSVTMINSDFRSTISFQLNCFAHCLLGRLCFKKWKLIKEVLCKFTGHPVSFLTLTDAKKTLFVSVFE